MSTLSGKIITEVKELLRRNQFAKVTDHLVAHRFILDAEVQLVEDFVYWSLKTSSPGAAVALGRGIAEYTDLSASLFNDLAVFLQRTANKDLALELMEVAVVKSPGEYRIKNNYGSALNAIGRVAEARSIFLELVNKFPNYSPPKVNLALLYQAEGRFEEARALHKQVLHEDNKNYVNIYNFSRVMRRQDLKDFEILLKDMDPLKLKVQERSLYYFSFARLCELSQDWRGQQHYLSLGNDLRNNIVSFDPQADEKLLKFVDEVSRSIKRTDIDRLKNIQFLYITGLPRSGTTLLEQAILENTGITQLGESTFWNQVIAKLPFIEKLKWQKYIEEQL